MADFLFNRQTVGRKLAFLPLRIVKYQYLRLLRLREKPHKIALGFAIGAFIGFTPTIPVQTYLAVPLAFICRGSALAAAVAVWISNPLTLVVFYYADFIVGKWVTGENIKLKVAEQFIKKIFTHAEDATAVFYHPEMIWTLFVEFADVFRIMMVGGVVLGIPFGIGFYFLIYKLVEINNKRRELRLAARKLTSTRQSGLWNLPVLNLETLLSRSVPDWAL
jgi:uncharacterized protein (DUF2062 family)